MIKFHEGFIDRVYADSLGNLTCGYGHFLDVGSFVPKEVAEIFFKLDFIHAQNNYNRITAKFGFTLDEVRKAVLIDMLFNLGYGGVMKFGKFLAALTIGDYDEAADQMVDSLWAKQVKTRAVRLAKMMRTGEDSDFGEDN